MELLREQVMISCLTGAVELNVTALTVLNTAKQLTFEIKDGIGQMATTFALPLP